MLRSPPSTETTSVSVGATLEESTNTMSETAVAETEMNGPASFNQNEAVDITIL